MSRKFLFLVTILLLSSLIFSACSGNDVKNVEKQISTLDVVDESTGEYLQEIEQAYNALSDSQKEKVKNYDHYLLVLSEYESYLRIIDIQNKIDTIGTLSWDSKSLIDEIKLEYSKLTEAEQIKVNNYTQLENAESEYEKYMISSVADAADDLDYYSYNQRNLNSTKLFAYYDYMSDVQKKDCLALYLFYKEAPDYVQNTIKNALKNPSSYTLYNMDVDSVITYDEEDDVFTGWIDITYGGTNSFGGMVKESVTVWVDYSVDINKKTIKFEDITIWDF